MNDSNEKITEINGKIKKYAIAVSAFALIIAVMAVASKSVRQINTKEQTTVPFTQEQEVEAKVTNEPDTRSSETIIVPATEITTLPASEEVMFETEESTTAEAPASYILPMGTDIGSDYSCGIPVYNSVMGDWRTHDGVDFNGEYGDGVKSMADGVVRNVAEDPFYGSIITVDHGGGIVATYGGVEPCGDVVKGGNVTQGQKLGEICEIPCEADAQFPHLHLEIRKEGALCDPLEIMGFYE